MTGFDAELRKAEQPNRWRSTMTLAAIALAALALALATVAAGVNAGAIAPVLGSVAIGPLSLSTTIENRICLQRALKAPCRQPVYTLKLGVDTAQSVRFYSLARLPISERYAYYP